ncbi:MAG: DUF4124 domain-containing protein [Brachymonas sp.]|nr:DUF4124 domain-containing protein [Brachymonas sp.]
MAWFHVKHRVRHVLLLAHFMALLLGAGSASYAQKMYRCPSPGGGTTFTDTPCATGAGGEITVKPAAGATGHAAARPDPQTRGAMDKKEAEFNALLSPECRRARQALQAKADQKGGMDELMKEGNPIFKAWENCQGETKVALDKLHADARNQGANQGREMVRKNECAAKQHVLNEKRQKTNTLNEKDRADLRVLEDDIALNCR